MDSTLHEKILKLLAQKPNQKADELAKALGATRPEVNKALYGPLKTRVQQDRSYRWSLTSIQEPSGAEDTSAFPDTNLARLCRYYLTCLGHDDSAGVSTFLTSQYEPDYTEVKILPRSTLDLAENEAARKMLGRKRTERGRYGLYFGYPTHISQIKSRRTGWEGFVVEPLLLFPIEQEEGSGRLMIDLSFPIVNQKPFQNFTSAERDMLMTELVQLETELGLAGGDDRPDLEEVALRLQAIRPEWPWAEEIDPSKLGDDRPAITTINKPGIYNRAVILMAEKSPFTQGLEKELRELAGLSEKALAGTVLGRWLLSTPPSAENVDEAVATPLLEVLPMNFEQRLAVGQALKRPITIITGPPGTGKSQVVTNLLVNAAWSGKRVLFASKNNKAVDVVETRVNSLGSRPVLLRMGAAQSFQSRLAEHLLALTSITTSTAEQDEFEEARALYERLIAEQQRLRNEASQLIELRNEVDRLEQEAENARSILGDVLFQKISLSSFDKIANIIAQLSRAYTHADRSQATLPIRLLWPLLESRRHDELRNAINAVSNDLKSHGFALPDLKKPLNTSAWQAAFLSFNARLREIEKSAKYKDSLERLSRARTLEGISKAEAELIGRIAQQSSNLWKLWLRLQPARLTAEERTKLSQYTTLLRMVMEAGEDGQLSRQAQTQYSAMLRDIAHLLPCWAVTSLSARGRIPFQPGIFDIVVFDEASQCDIASALPLLYRAKSVVVIGDPKQLSHISGLKKGQDQALLEKHGLMQSFVHWAYSHQSLFGLAAANVTGGDIINLVDHHRSHADIIGFSNKEFYEDRLRVATSYDRLKSPNRTEPGIRWIDVRGHTSRPGTSGALNKKEVDAVVLELRDLVLNKGYAGTVGVVTPFRAQANAITEAVNRDEQLATALISRQFLADTVHSFQGDERDVMIFSPTVADGILPGALGFLRSNGNLFNVAITRARAQLIVVGDRTACSASDVGYLSRFAAYTELLEKAQRTQLNEQAIELGPQYPTVARPETVSDWERIFYVAAYAQGLRLIPQFPIEKYVADFLLTTNERRLVIEIDGERYHRNWTGELCRRDQIRNQRLFELGYDVMRFWVYEVRDNLDGCLQRVKGWRDKTGL